MADVANSIAKLWGPGAFIFPSQGVHHQGLYYPAVSITNLFNYCAILIIRQIWLGLALRYKCEINGIWQKYPFLMAKTSTSAPAALHCFQTQDQCHTTINGQHL